MKIFRYLLVFPCLLFQASGCFASPENVINFSVLPDPIAHCHGYEGEVAMTENSTLGMLVAPECISDRPTFYGSSYTTFTNKFNRIVVPWKYMPHGVFEDGIFLMVLAGAEASEFKTAAGSTANVSFIDTGFHIGYQWFWDNGFNVSAVAGVAHLIRNSLDQNISLAESNTGIDFLVQQTSTNTHMGVGLTFGWAF